MFRKVVTFRNKEQRGDTISSDVIRGFQDGRWMELVWIVSSESLWCYSTLHKIRCIVVTEKSGSIAIPTAEPKLISVC
jgi:hypothetical protein